MDLPGARVAVTGGRGFLGSHLEPELAAAVATVVAIGRHDYDLRSRV